MNVHDSLSSPQQAFLITGASSGIGEATALALDRLGHRVFAGVRDTAGADALRRNGSKRLEILLLDVTQEAQIAAALETVEAKLGEARFAGLVSNAGVQVSGPLECISADSLREQLNVNVVGAMAVISAFLPLLRAHKGRIVNIGSTSGRIPSAYLGPYCASKYALEALTSVLRLELGPFDIQVSMIEPGAISTPFWKKAARAEKELARSLGPDSQAIYGDQLSRRQPWLLELGEASEDPRRVTAAVVDALTATSPKLRYVIGLRPKIRTALSKYLPEVLYTWLMQRRAAR